MKWLQQCLFNNINRAELEMFAQGMRAGTLMDLARHRWGFVPPFLNPSSDKKWDFLLVFCWHQGLRRALGLSSRFGKVSVTH